MLLLKKNRPFHFSSESMSPITICVHGFQRRQSCRSFPARAGRAARRGPLGATDSPRLAGVLRCCAGPPTPWVCSLNPADSPSTPRVRRPLWLRQGCAKSLFVCHTGYIFSPHLSSTFFIQLSNVTTGYSITDLPKLM